MPRIHWNTLPICAQVSRNCPGGPQLCQIKPERCKRGISGSNSVTFKWADEITITFPTGFSIQGEKMKGEKKKKEKKESLSSSLLSLGLVPVTLWIQTRQYPEIFHFVSRLNQKTSRFLFFSNNVTNLIQSFKYRAPISHLLVLDRMSRKINILAWIQLLALFTEAK